MMDDSSSSKNKSTNDRVQTTILSKMCRKICFRVREEARTKYWTELLDLEFRTCAGSTSCTRFIHVLTESARTAGRAGFSSFDLTMEIWHLVWYTIELGGFELRSVFVRNDRPFRKRIRQVDGGKSFFLSLIMGIRFADATSSPMT